MIDFYTSPANGTAYLAFRDIPRLIYNHGPLENALDFGCGAGRSTYFLDSLKLNVTGVDINKEMLEKAKKSFANINFMLMNLNELPFNDHAFDVVFNSFVLFDMASPKELITNFKEMKRVCKKNGIVISITNSDYLFKKNWLTVKNNYPENKNLHDGDIAKIYLSDAKITLYDYFWSEKTYLECLSMAGFKHTFIHKTLGKKTDGIEWVEEYTFSPYSIFVSYQEF